MLDDEFEYEMKKLEAHVGRKLTESQKESWFNKLSYLSAVSFRNAIDKLTDRKNTLPTVEEIREVAKEFRGIAEPIKIVGCEDCRSTGWIHAEKIGEKHQDYAFRCSCRNGENFSSKIPTWGYQYYREFKKL